LLSTNKDLRTGYVHNSLNLEHEQQLLKIQFYELWSNLVKFSVDIQDLICPLPIHFYQNIRYVSYQSLKILTVLRVKLTAD